MRAPAVASLAKTWLVSVLAAVVTTTALRAQDTVRAAQTAPAKIIGKVTDTLGVPLASAEISIFQTALRTLSDDSGKFVMQGLPSGIVVFSVRRLGYEAATFTAVLRPGKTHGVTFPLTELAQALPGLTVEEDSTPSAWLAVFEKRRSTNRGTFFTRRDIERRQARVTSDLMRLVPGVQVVNTRLGTQLVMTRGAGTRRCVPQLYIHTTPYSGMIDDFPASDIEAVEVYAGISELPAELNTVGRSICAAVVIWTREPPPRKKRKS